ncbi:MAG TPA: hypothetical protein VF788_09600 [Pseudonocardiaceae bacterium]
MDPTACETNDSPPSITDNNATGPLEVIRDAIADIDKAHNVAIAAVEAAQDPVTAFAGAKELAAHMQALAEADSKLREQLSGRIRDVEKLSLAGLGDRAGMSAADTDKDPLV